MYWGQTVRTSGPRCSFCVSVNQPPSRDVVGWMTRGIGGRPFSWLHERTDGVSLSRRATPARAPAAEWRDGRREHGWRRGNNYGCHQGRRNWIHHGSRLKPPHTHRLGRTNSVVPPCHKRHEPVWVGVSPSRAVRSGERPHARCGRRCWHWRRCWPLGLREASHRRDRNGDVRQIGQQTGDEQCDHHG